MMQQAWVQGLNWDEKPPKQLQQAWEHWFGEPGGYSMTRTNGRWALCDWAAFEYARLQSVRVPKTKCVVLDWQHDRGFVDSRAESDVQTFCSTSCGRDS